MYSAFKHLTNEISYQLVNEYGGTGYHLDYKNKKISVNFLGNDYLFHVVDFVVGKNNKVLVVDEVFDWDLNKVKVKQYPDFSIDQVQDILISIWTLEAKGSKEFLA